MSEQRQQNSESIQEIPTSPDGGSRASVSWLRNLARQAQLTWRLWTDPRVSWAVKLIPPALLVYVLSPLDFLPDVMPGLGQLDDIAIVLLGVKFFVDLCPANLVQEHLRELEGTTTEAQDDVVEGEFSVIGDED